MEKFPKSGTPSSSLESESRSQQYRSLDQLADDPRLTRLVNILGPDSDLHLVGGTVRESLLGNSHTDFDLAMATSVDRAIRAFEESSIRVIPTGIKHGTITVVLNGTNIELTTFRAGRTTQSRTIEADLSERDFTINAMAFHLTSRRFVDPHHGLTDLKNNHLRAVGDPADRFREDPLRILRMIRFGFAAGREVDHATVEAAKEMADLLSGVSVERIRIELEKILMSDHAASGVRSLARCKLLTYTWPELIPTIGFEQNDFHIHDVFEHTLHVLEACPPDKILRLAALYHDIGKAHTLSVGPDGKRHFYEHEKVSAEICERSMKRLRFSTDEIEAVTLLCRMHMRPFDCGPAGVRRLLRALGDEFTRWREFKNADRPAVFDDDKLEQLKKNFDEMVQTERNRTKGSVYNTLAVSGDDLIAIGFKPGKFMGEILKTLKEAVLDNPELNEKETLLEHARLLLKKSGSIS